jgi:putative redox protein
MVGVRLEGGGAMVSVERVLGERPAIEEIDTVVVGYRWLRVGAVLMGEGHCWVGDEPRAVGGDGTGASPFCHVNAALAQCTISTMAARARLEGIPLEDCEVTVRGLVGIEGRGMFRDLTELPPLGDESNFECRIKRFVRTIKVTGDLTAAQVERLKLFADRCPVSESFAPAIPTRTTIEHVERIDRRPVPGPNRRPPSV